MKLRGSSGSASDGRRQTLVGALVVLEAHAVSDLMRRVQKTARWVAWRVGTRLKGEGGPDAESRPETQHAFTHKNITKVKHSKSARAPPPKSGSRLLGGGGALLRAVRLFGMGGVSRPPHEGASVGGGGGGDPPASGAMFGGGVPSAVRARPSHHPACPVLLGPLLSRPCTMLTNPKYFLVKYRDSRVSIRQLRVPREIPDYRNVPPLQRDSQIMCITVQLDAYTNSSTVLYVHIKTPPDLGEGWWSWTPRVLAPSAEGGVHPPTTLRRSFGGGVPMLSEGHPPHRAICCRSNISAPQTGWAGLYVHQL